MPIINRETLSQILELELAGEAVVQKKIPLVAWIGWALAGVLFIIMIVFAAKLLPIMLSPLDVGEVITYEESVIVEEIGIKSIRFFDSAANEVLPEANWYNAAEIENILITWNGGAAESIQMFATPTGTETMEQTELLGTKAISDGESAALLSADALHSDKISSVHLYFQINIDGEVVTSKTYNVFYE